MSVLMSGIRLHRSRVDERRTDGKAFKMRYELTLKNGRLVPKVLMALSMFCMIIGCSIATTSRSGTSKTGASSSDSSSDILKKKRLCRSCLLFVVSEYDSIRCHSWNQVSFLELKFRTKLLRTSRNMKVMSACSIRLSLSCPNSPN